MTAKAPAKKPSLSEAIELVEKMHGPPLHAERSEDPLLDHLLVGVLGLRAGLEKGRAAVRALSESFHDFNEVRVSALFELATTLEPFVGEEQARAAAIDVRMTLQDVFDGTHGLDLEPLRGREPEDQRSFLKEMPHTPGGPAALVFQIAMGEERLVLGQREQHLLRRLGLLPTASNAPRLRAAMEKVVPAGERYRFAWALGASAHLFEKDLDPEHPFCKLLVACRAKELVERERERKKEEARQKVEAKKRAIEAERRKKVEEIERKRREAEDQKRQAKEKKEAERRAREEARASAAAEKAAKAKAAKEAKEAAARAKRDALKAKAQKAKKAAAKKKASAKKKR
jgi:hypothetical protein